MLSFAYMSDRNRLRFVLQALVNAYIARICDDVSMHRHVQTINKSVVVLAFTRSLSGTSTL